MDHSTDTASGGPPPWLDETLRRLARIRRTSSLRAVRQAAAHAAHLLRLAELDELDAGPPGLIRTPPPQAGLLLRFDVSRRRRYRCEVELLFLASGGLIARLFPPGGATLESRPAYPDGTPAPGLRVDLIRQVLGRPDFEDALFPPGSFPRSDARPNTGRPGP
jgi:hypothetical protein